LLLIFLTIVFPDGCGTCCSAKLAADDHEFVHRSVVEKALDPGASDRRAMAFSSKLICQDPAVWTGFYYFVSVYLRPCDRPCRGL